LFFLLSFTSLGSAIAQEKTHALSIHGDVKYGSDFKHFGYVNPVAPKGGTLKLSASGTFDTLNRFILKGVPAAGLGLIHETLLTSSSDEAFSEYGLVAKDMVLSNDRSFIDFTLHQSARWHDGEPITADDVIWTFETLKEKGNPFYKSYYKDIKEVTSKNTHHVRFSFTDTKNRELPLIIGQLPVLPKHYWTKNNHDFSKTTLSPPLGSGPYKIKDIQPGRSITYERVKDWWGKDLPVNKGRYNFDEIRFDYYRDNSVSIQAFLAGDYDARQENTAKTWATSYVSPMIKNGKIILSEIPNQLPTGMQGFIFNTRRPVFKDINVRKAVNYAFDFEWSNKQFAYDAYTRTRSYFSNSQLASSGIPKGKERDILLSFKDQLPEELFTQPFSLPRTDGSGNNRSNLRKAIKILDSAGWKMNHNKIREKDGVLLSFEVIVNNPAFERWFNPFVQNLKRIGVEAKLRVLDTAQYQNRLTEFDFDMTVGVFPQSNSPGNEQRDFWHSSRVNLSGSLNTIGVNDPVIDDLIEKIILSQTRDDLIANTRALDRVLLWGHYVIPNWHINVWRIAYWNKFGIPENTAPYSLGMIDTWWYDQNHNHDQQPAIR
jgi:microcin C transport system substrate-binding protein